MTICKDCGKPLAQKLEKALNGKSQVVWAQPDGDWICEVTGDEHDPM